MKCHKCKEEIDLDLVIRKHVTKTGKVIYYNYHRGCLYKYYLSKFKKDEQKAQEQLNKDIDSTEKIVKDRKDNNALVNYIENHYKIKLAGRWFTRDRKKIEILENYRPDWFLEFMQNEKTKRNLQAIQTSRATRGQEELHGYALLQYEIAVLASKYFNFVKAKMNKNKTTNKEVELQKQLLKEASRMKVVDRTKTKTKTKRDTLDDFLL